MPQNNELLTDDIIVKEALRLLKNELVFAKLVYRNLEAKFAKKGDTISLKLPFRVKAADGRVLVKQPMIDKKQPFSIDYQHHVGLEYTINDYTLSIQDFSERYLKSAMIQIANKVDANIALTLKKTFHTSGTPGVKPGKFIDYANAGAKQTTYGVPQDGMRRAVLTPFTCASLSDEVTKLFNDKMVKKAYVAGYQGKVSTYDTYESNNLPVHKVGDYGGTPLVAGEVVNGDTVGFDGGTASIANFLNVGDVITFGGVYGVNPQGYATTGLLQEFVVLETVATDAGGAGSIKLFPELNDGTGTITNDKGESVSDGAYQNVTNLPADNAPITVAGTADSTYEMNYLFHKDAIALAVMQMHLPESAVRKSRVSDPQSGLSLMLTAAYDITEQSEITRIDILYGCDLIDGALALRQWGGESGA